MRIRLYEKLIVWKRAHELCVSIYQVTKSFPAEEKFGLTNQMRRSGYSVPTNIAEGNGRRSKKEKIHFIDIAVGSLEELHYQCTLSYDLSYISADQKDALHSQINGVGYLLYKLRNSFL